MTTLAERAKIERDAVSDPASLPAGSTEQEEVTAARLLLARIRSAVLDVAETVISDATAVPSAGLERDKIGWARSVIASPDQAQMEVLRVLLAKFGESTVAQIAAVTDVQMVAAVTDLVPRLAAGRGIGR
jgi:hypothetical protein